MKKRKTSNLNSVSINNFLSEAYPEFENKFADGFANEIVSLFDDKTLKNKDNTHGGILDQKSIASVNRYFDLIIDGGLTGIEQFLVNEDGTKEIISKDKVVGLKFYARFWLPAGGNTGYMFIQKYAGLSIKPLFDDILNEVLKKHGLIVIGRIIRPTTSKKRLKKFLETSSIRDVTVISKNSNHDTGAGDAQSVTVKIKNIEAKTEDKQININVVSDALKNHGFKLGERQYEISATYVSIVEGKKEEEKTVKLDTSEDTINIIPNIILPSKCIDDNGYPIFFEMKRFVDEEVEQIKKEAKM